MVLSMDLFVCVSGRVSPFSVRPSAPLMDPDRLDTTVCWLRSPGGGANIARLKSTHTSGDGENVAILEKPKMS